MLSKFVENVRLWAKNKPDRTDLYSNRRGKPKLHIKLLVLPLQIAQ